MQHMQIPIVRQCCIRWYSNSYTIYLFKQRIIHSKQNKNYLSSRSAAETIRTGKLCPACRTLPCMPRLPLRRLRPPLSRSSPLLARNAAKTSSSNPGSRPTHKTKNHQRRSHRSTNKDQDSAWDREIHHTEPWLMSTNRQHKHSS